MLEFGQEAVQMARGRARGDLDRSREIRLALERLVEIVCEAAYRIPVNGRAKYPQISWKGIVGMRQKLVHDYYKVDLDILWVTVDQEPPAIDTSDQTNPRRQARQALSTVSRATTSSL
jgi:uncharacterized protein with HEPN domain